eukprot:GEMP01037220.1.p1 GENE.GEMP01037220.1~~GEMP01037220.1.p1  ORF type:complete len:306 (+),score=72.05 GEMP01037220.1:255-1172(+)
MSLRVNSAVQSDYVGAFGFLIAAHGIAAGQRGTIVAAVRSEEDKEWRASAVEKEIAHLAQSLVGGLSVAGIYAAGDDEFLTRHVAPLCISRGFRCIATASNKYFAPHATAKARMLPMQVDIVDVEFRLFRSPLSLCMRYDGAPTGAVAEIQKRLDDAHAFMDKDDEVTFLLKQDVIAAESDIVRIFLIAVCVVLLDKNTNPKDDAARFLREDAVRQVKDRLEMAEEHGRGKARVKIPVRVVSGFRGQLLFPDSKQEDEVELPHIPAQLDEVRYLRPPQKTELHFPWPLRLAVFAVVLSAVFMLLY